MADHARRRPSSKTEKTEARVGTWENIILAWRLYRDPRVSVWLKRLPVVLALVYLVVPFDLIPDVLIGAGQVDDLGMMGLMALALTWLPKFAPADVVAEHRAKMRWSRGARDGGGRRSEGRADPGNERGDVIDPPFRVHR